MKKLHLNRREFLKTGAAGLTGLSVFLSMEVEISAAEEEPFPELIEISIGEAQSKLRSGQWTSRRLVEM